MNTVYLYHVIDSAGLLRYVGASVKPYGRLLAHISEGAYAERNPFKRHGEQFHRWLHRECQAGRTPNVRIVGILPDDWRPAEHKAILLAREQGHPILNTMYRGAKMPSDILLHRKANPSVRVRRKLRAKPARPRAPKG